MLRRAFIAMLSTVPFMGPMSMFFGVPERVSRLKEISLRIANANIRIFQEPLKDGYWLVPVAITASTISSLHLVRNRLTFLDLSENKG